MAYIAACTDKGAKRRTNQDACCVQVAQTSFGEVLMAIVCDGVGGLSAGELASATVVYRFVQWFNEELPTLMAGMSPGAGLDFSRIEMVWGVLLTNLNNEIRTYGAAHKEMLGTTFSGIIMCGGSYLIGHVGDCRVYQISPRAVRQVTEDQTLLAKKLASGEISPEEARTFGQKHVILQSVGTEGLLHPVFYEGSCSPADLFVLCCDGAYRKAEDEGMQSFFLGLDHTDEGALARACQAVLAYDLQHGEKDNLTVVCVSADLATAAARPSATQQGARGASTGLGADARSLAREEVGVPGQAQDPITMVYDEDDDLPTAVEQDDDLPTMVDSAQDADDLPTMVEPTQDGLGFDDAPTMVEGDDA